MSITEQDAETVDLAYLVERADSLGDAVDRFFTHGMVRALPVDDVPSFSIERALICRGAHSYYTGPLRVRTWRARENEHHTLPAPNDATTIHFPAGQPTAGEVDELDADGGTAQERADDTDRDEQHQLYREATRA
jgi:hypothetical protein